MKYEEQIKAIAKSVGWSSIRASGRLNGSLMGYPPKNPVIGLYVGLPDFLNDLNAMHEVELHLLLEVFEGPEGGALVTTYESLLKPREWPRQKWCTTAKERAEAYLKTLGLWNDNND